MKSIGIAFMFILLLGCQQTSTIEESVTDKSGYDSLLAKQVQADPYGMRKYVFAFLKEGPNRDQDSLLAAQIQKAHMDNISRMTEDGKLVVAGPFMDDQEIKGIYIFAFDNLEEAEELTNSDPAVQAGRLIMELHPWYSSAALMEVNNIHKKIAKENF